MEMKMMHNNYSLALFAWGAALAGISQQAPVKDDRSKRFMVFVTQFINRCPGGLSIRHQFKTRSKLRLKGRHYRKPHPPIPATLLHLAEKMKDSITNQLAEFAPHGKPEPHGLRRQAQRDAAFNSETMVIKPPKGAVAAPLCQRTP